MKVGRKVRHGRSRKPEHWTWNSMLQRCLNSNHKDFSDYGGRGIKVCSRWLVFDNFLSDMGLRPDGKTLERKDTNGNYEPSNCVWATPKEQARNRRNSVFVTHNGKTLTVSQWAEEFGLPRETLDYRLEKGWPMEKALSTPHKSANRTNTHRGVTLHKVGKWVATVRKKYLGLFETEQLAIAARDDYERSNTH